jgi:hypothetical protein
MSRNKPPKDIRDRREKWSKAMLTPAEKGVVRRSISKGWKILLGLITLLATILGVVTAILSLVPKISVSALEAQDPAIPFPAPFSVSNDSPLGINKVKMSCILIHISDFTGHEFVTDAATTNFFPDISHMEPGEQATLPCVLPMKSMNPYVHDAEIAIVVNFRPDYVWRRQEKRFLFYTLPQKDGILRWYQQPYSAYPDVTGHKAPFSK